MNRVRLLLSALILISGTILVALGKISGETWGAMLVGLLIPSPLDRKEDFKKTVPKSLISILFFLIPSFSFAGILTDNVIVTPQSAPICYSGRACIYAKTADNLFYTKDITGLELKLHAAQSFRSSANCTLLASPTLGDICYDTTLNMFKFFGNTGWTNGAVDGAQYVTKTQVETITGAKTFTGGVTLSSNTTIGTDNLYAIGGLSTRLSTIYSLLIHSGASTLSMTSSVSDGAAAIGFKTNTANSFANATARLVSVQNNNVEKAAILKNGELLAPSLGPSATQQHSIPAVANDVITLLNAVQTLTNKTISAPILSGTITGSYTIGGTATVQANTLTIGGAPAEAGFYRVCTLPSVSAATPQNCLLDADVPVGKSVYLTHFTAKVNGMTAWGTVMACTIEDTASNLFVSIPVANLTANAFLGMFTAGLTLDNRLMLGTGGTSGKGLQIKCDVNGTGSDLVVVLQGVIR